MSGSLSKVTCAGPGRPALSVEAVWQPASRAAAPQNAHAPAIHENRALYDPAATFYTSRFGPSRLFSVPKPLEPVYPCIAPSEKPAPSPTASPSFP